MWALKQRLPRIKLASLLFLIAISLLLSSPSVFEIHAQSCQHLPADAISVGEVTGWRDAHDHDAAHVTRWNRVLAALGENTGESPLSIAQSRENESQFMRSRWSRVTRTLEALDKCANPPPPTNTPVPPPPPTNTPVPPPPPSNTPVPPPPPSNTPVPPPPSGPHASLIQTLLGYQAENHGAAHVERWTRALAALGHGSHANPMTLAEAKDMAQQFSSSRWQPVVDALQQLQSPPSNTPIPPPPPATDTPVPTNTPVPPPATDTPTPPPPTNTPVPPPPSNTPVPPTPQPIQNAFTPTTFTVSPAQPSIQSGTSGRISLLIKPNHSRLKGYVQIRPGDEASAQMAGISLSGDNGGRFGKDCGWNDPHGSAIGAGRTCHLDYNWSAGSGQSDTVVLQFVEFTDDDNQDHSALTNMATLNLIRAATATNTPLPATNTPIPTATNTPIPPTNTPIPTATDNPIPPTATDLPATDAPVAQADEVTTVTTFTASPAQSIITSGTSGRISLLITANPSRLRGYIRIKPGDEADAQTAGISLTGDNGGAFSQDCGWDDASGSDIGTGRTCHIDYNWSSNSKLNDVVLQFVEYASDDNTNSIFVSDIATLSFLRGMRQVSRSYSGSWDGASTINEGGTAGTLTLRVSPSPGYGVAGCAMLGYVEIDSRDSAQAAKAGIMIDSPSPKSFTDNKPGWNDGSCTDARLNSNGYREVTISYTFPSNAANDNGTVRINYVDLQGGGSDSFLVGTITMVDNVLVGPAPATGNFWLVFDGDTLGANDGVINEGGVVWMRIHTSSDPGSALVAIQARKGTGASTIDWGSWGAVEQVVAIDSDPKINGRAGKGIYSNYLGEACARADNFNSCAGGLWTQVGGEWYANLYMYATEDSFISEAKRHFQFRVHNSTSSRSHPIISINEDDGYGGSGDAPAAVYMEPTYYQFWTLTGKRHDYLGLRFDIGRGHYEGYRIEIEDAEGAAQGGYWDGSLTISVAAGDQYKWITHLATSDPCPTAGAGWVTASVYSLAGAEYTTPVIHGGGTGPIQICW